MAIRDDCPAEAEATADLAAAIMALDGQAWEYTYAEILAGDWPCDLIAGHAGSHVAHVLTTPADEEYWLRWTSPADLAFVCREICEAARELDGDETYCLLPDGHDGPHHDARDGDWA